MTQRYNFQPYDFTLTPGGSQTILVMGEYFRIQAATGAVTVTVEGYGKLPGLLTGQGLQRVPYSRLILTDASGAANAGVILCSGAEFVDNRTYGVNSLDAPTIAAIKNPTAQNGSYGANAAMIGNVAEVVVSPAANVNGVIILSGGCSDGTVTSAGLTDITLLAKNAAPANAADGIIYLKAVTMSIIATRNFSRDNVSQPLHVAAGLGLYFIAAVSTDGFSAQRYLRYKLL